MVQAESSSWQSSVVELAQAGNLRAIAFWINRYLVPQGICAQVLSERPGYLLIRVVCHRVPDRDRLVHFICYRLGHLNSQVIQAIRVTAQLVGNPKLLWEKSAAVVPLIGNPSTSVAKSAAQPAPVRSNQATPLAAAQPPQRPAHSSTNPSIQFVEHPRPATPNAVAPIPGQPPKQPPKQPGVLRKRKLKSKRPILVQWSRSAVRQAIVLPETVRQFSVQSADWFTEQTLPVRALTVGGSAIAVFFVGCGFELMRQYTIDPGFGQGAPFQASFIRSKPGTVQTALDQIPVIRPTVANPDDPNVTLLFSNSAALGRVSEAAAGRESDLENLEDTDLESTEQAIEGGLSVYQQADLVMTSLAHSLSLQQLLTPNTEDATDSARSTRQLTLPSPEQEMVPSRIGDRDREQTDDEEMIDDEKEDGSSGISSLPEATVHELLANGVDVVNLASDRSGQSQSAEVVQTVDVLQRSNIQFLGTGNSSREARQPRIFDVKGQRIAYLGYADPTLAGALAMETGIAPSLKKQMAEDIQSIRDQVDWIVVSFRWQRELRAYPESWQVELSHLAIDQGADLVVGYHPYLTQGAEVYKGRAIAYSLGSSVEEFGEYNGEYNDENEEKVADRNTVSLKVTLQDQQMKLEFLPMQLRQEQVTLAEGEDATNILGYLERASSLFEQPMRSSMLLDARVRMSLPSAPDSDLPTEPFLSYPESPNGE